LNGLILIDKPSGLTSHDVVAQARKILKIKDIGHCGTLDPMATGLLVLSIGEGTKISQIVTDGDKTYQGQIQLGIQTDTLDITGQVVTESPINHDFEFIKNVAQNLTGPMHVAVPKYSAMKVDGQRLYDKARNETEDFTPPSKEMNFYDISCYQDENKQIEFQLSCSKGSFVRSWVDLLGQKLGGACTLKSLRRIKSGSLSLEKAVTLEQLKIDQDKGLLASLEAQFAKPLAVVVEGEPSRAQMAGLGDYYIPLSLALPEWKPLSVAQQDLRLIQNGQISHSLKAHLIRLYQPTNLNQKFQVKVLHGLTGDLVALIELEVGKGFYLKRVFKPQSLTLE